jgi:hypothetical protein
VITQGAAERYSAAMRIAMAAWPSLSAGSAAIGSFSRTLNHSE